MVPMVAITEMKIEFLKKVEKEIFANPSLQMATFTITEKGYSLVNGKGEQLA